MLDMPRELLVDKKLELVKYRQFLRYNKIRNMARNIDFDHFKFARPISMDRHIRISLPERVEWQCSAFLLLRIIGNLFYTVFGFIDIFLRIIEIFSGLGY